MNRFILLAQRNRALMLEQGLSPELCKKFLEQTISLQRTNFEIIKSSLSEDDRDYIHALILQGEMMLDIIRRSCVP